MKILILSPWALPNQHLGGVSSVTKYLVENFEKLEGVQNINIVSFNCYKSEKPTLIKESFKLTVTHLSGQKKLTLLFNNFLDSFKLKKYINSLNWKPDIIHGQGISSYGLHAIRLGKWLNVPTVITVHGMVDIEAKLYRDKVRATFVKRMMNDVLSRANSVIFTVPYRMDELKKLIRGKTYVLENPISDLFFQDASRVERTDKVVFVGLVSQRKRVLDLINAFKLVTKKFNKVHLNIIGPNTQYEYNKQMKDLISDLKLEDKVNILGSINQLSLLEELNSAKIFTLCSEEETAPQAIAEAMAAGLPIVATNAGGIPFMVQEDVNGYLENVGDVESIANRIMLLIEDKSKWKKFSTASKSEAERFRGSRIAERTLNIYKETIEGCRKVK